MDKIVNQTSESTAMNKFKALIIVYPCFVSLYCNIQIFIVYTYAFDFCSSVTLYPQSPIDSDSHVSPPYSTEGILAYFPRKLDRMETCYSTYNKELLAIKDALK
jgi:hypothetical protein